MGDSTAGAAPAPAPHPAIADLKKAMDDAIWNNVNMQKLGIAYQENITAVNVQLAQVAARASKQVPQG